MTDSSNKDSSNKDNLFKSNFVEENPVKNAVMRPMLLEIKDGMPSSEDLMLMLLDHEEPVQAAGQSNEDFEAMKKGMRMAQSILGGNEKLPSFSDANFGKDETFIKLRNPNKKTLG